MADKFFDEREDQSEVKARIVSKYFFVWARIVGAASKARGENIAYIDLFAGPGRYKDGSASTPLMIVEQAAADPILKDILVTLFNDENPDHTASLGAELAKIPNIARLKFQPHIETGSIGEDVTKTLLEMRMIPTFSFIDPFGYKGLSLGLIKGAIKDWGSDCVFFFNYNRINAGISNPIVDKHMNSLFGKDRADELRKTIAGLSPSDREATVLEYLSAAIRELGGHYVLPFRFRNSTGKRSTHHLIFVSKHPLGYGIMKEIMAKESSTHDQGVASLEYSPAAANTPLLFSLQRSSERLADDLRTTYAGREMTMNAIYLDHNIDTPFIKRNYKDALLRLEDDGRIGVNKKKRRANTFADEVVVTFPTS